MDDISRGANAVFQKGQQVEQYQIVEVLTPTRFGHLYAGRHIHQSIQVLIEGLLTPLLDEFKADLLKCAQALKNLEHPHILCIRDMGVHQHYPFLVTDYLSYRTFNQVYAPRRDSGLPLSVPLPMVLPHLKQVASALQYVHSQSLLHGDLRPENILLSANNKASLRGFLLEAIMQNSRRLNYRGVEAAEHDAMIYAAPEQIQGNIGPASDQYALGILIYELLCGKAPFTGSSVEIAFQKMHAPAPSLRQKMPNRISPDVERVVMKVLEKEPERRFPDVQAFIDALEQEQSQSPGHLQSTVSIQPTIIITPPPVSPPAIPSTASTGFSGTAPASQMPLPDHPARILQAPASQVPPPKFLAKTLRMPVPPTFQGMAPMRVTPPSSLLAEPLGQVPEEFKQTTFKEMLPPPNEPPARRPESRSVTRRVFFAISLVGIASLGGAGGWYLLSRRVSRAAPPVVSSHTKPPAIQSIINNQKVLIFTGHLASINALTWSPDGKFIASASDDTFVQIFESTTGKRRIIYRGHTEEVAAVAWSPNGDFIASAGQDQTVQVWNAASGVPVFTYKGHTDRVNSVSWSSDSQSLASGSDDKSVQVWQASNGNPIFTFLGHTAGVLCVGWQPDDSSVASSSWDGTLRDWATIQHGDHFNAGDQIFKYSGHGTNAVYGLAWSPDSNFIVSAGADQTVQISNGDNGTPRPPFFTDHRRTDHVNRVFAVSWSPDGTSIASGDEDGNVYVWRTAGRKTFFKYTGHKGAVNAVAWSPDGNFIASASADNTVHVWQPV